MTTTQTLAEEARDIRECSDALYAEFANGRLPLDEFLAHARGERLTREEQAACTHPLDRLQLQEDGYTRTWSTKIDAVRKVITAVSGFGSEDYSDEGEGGDYLFCLDCSAHVEIPEDYDIDWQ